MKNRKLVSLLSLVLALITVLAIASPALAVNPTVSITVYADIIAITNDKDTWAIGHVQAGGAAVYFSTNGAQDDDWSTITNTGNQAVDVQIQGTDIEGGSYDWTLAAAAGDKAYSLYANKAATATTYDVQVKSSSYVDITAAAGLAAAGTNKWSMKFTPPTIFDASDDGASKAATVTLVARLHT